LVARDAASVILDPNLVRANLDVDSQSVTRVQFQEAFLVLLETADGVIDVFGEGVLGLIVKVADDFEDASVRAGIEAASFKRFAHGDMVVPNYPGPGGCKDIV
jgi:hypothetical protein